MALIAIHTVIDIIWIALVPRIGLGLGVAICALEDRIVVRIRMTDRAHSVSGVASMVQGEPRVVERCPRPRSCVVASCAGGCENSWRSAMHRVRRGIVIRFVAAVAIRRKRGVVVIHVTAGAAHLRVEASQRKRGRAVIKLAVGPESSVMAELAGRRETDLDVVDRSGCRVVIVQVAGNAGRVGTRQIVVVIDMAIGAGSRRNGVRVGQRKSRGRVIELAIRPNHGIVAAFAGCREAHLDVVHWCRRGVVILQMA